MFLTSTKLLPNGTHEHEAPFPQVWQDAKAFGLHAIDYGRTWFVYESRAQYEEAID